jgi:hypothetical protein
MPKAAYVRKRFGSDARAIINKANEIIEEYAAAGYDLTLRQLFYQFVSRDLLANTQKNYKKLGQIVNDARLAGLIDWNRIEDRTRGVEALATWDSPSDIVAACASQFRNDLWGDQPCRVEVWIEKEALAGVFERVCNELRVPYLSCRGYTSQSEMWRASQRLLRYTKDGQEVHILHFGDHDPSGIDMSRDITERLAIFGVDLEFERLALNMDQVEEHNPPPNPAKLTDTRATAYIARFGDESWELDALDPTILSGMVRDAVTKLLDAKKWKHAVKEEEEHKRLLKVAADEWEDLMDGK